MFTGKSRICVPMIALLVAIVVLFGALPPHGTAQGTGTDPPPREQKEVTGNPKQVGPERTIP